MGRQLRMCVCTTWCVSNPRGQVISRALHVSLTRFSSSCGVHTYQHNNIPGTNYMVSCTSNVVWINGVPSYTAPLTPRPTNKCACCLACDHGLDFCGERMPEMTSKDAREEAKDVMAALKTRRKRLLAQAKTTATLQAPRFASPGVRPNPGIWTVYFKVLYVTATINCCILLQHAPRVHAVGVRVYCAGEGSYRNGSSMIPYIKSSHARVQAHFNLHNHTVTAKQTNSCGNVIVFSQSQTGQRHQNRKVYPASCTFE